GPFNAFGLIGLLFAIGGMLVYAMTNVSTFTLYFFRYGSEFSVFKHLVIPLLAIVVLAFPLLVSLFPGQFNQPSMYPLSLAMPISFGWFAVGVGFYLYLRAKKPEALERVRNEMSQAGIVTNDDVFSALERPETCSRVPQHGDDS